MNLVKDLTIPPPITLKPISEQLEGVNSEWATLGAGCFGPPDMIYTRTIGVLQTQVGYMGGHDIAPTYAKVCARETGHAEVVLVEYDPAIINYNQILDLYFTMFDPTVLNSDTVGKGAQYRSVVFYHNEEQRKIAQDRLDALQLSSSNAKIVTELQPLATFYPAEVYQQRYLEKHGQRSFKGCTDPIIKIP
ncbi:Peptide methionine sulfoxide reductase A2-2 [Smittium mucronatum]|uniref:peptide-methionine (S)-S-oxide reductase n=1 Tax=Smittium mucronatum TaxID=133383 RepID=A0A1R0H695_9FUNG|nr:Peptide methionine sulfoxide reductase A2-2 [Smittium mucronatum]